MNEAIISNNGKILIKELPRPKLQSESVIIKQECFGINYDDTKVLNGNIKNPNPYGILGIESSGTIEQVSEDCKKGFSIGDRVCYATYHPGAFVKYRNVHENYLIPIPKYLNTEGGSTLLKGLMAYTILGKVFVINAPAFIILSGASGGIGSIITQIASRAKMHVIALTSSDEKIDYIKSNGASSIINYKKGNVAEKIMQITKGEGADYFFDCLGKDSQSFAFESLKIRGFFIQFGTITGESNLLNLQTQRAKSITTTRITLNNFIANYNNFAETSFAYMKSIQAGVIKPQIQVYSFNKPEQAFLDIKNGVSFGQKILTL